MMTRLPVAAAVAAGGAVGAVLRYAVGLAFGPAQAGNWPIPTLLCNLLGSLLLGWLNGIASVRQVHPVWKEGLGTGVIGAYTTFSALSVETVELIRGGYYGTAAGYIGVSIAAGLLATSAGMMAARRLERKRGLC